MKDKLVLMIPGPTPVPESVLSALGRHPMGHRSADFSTILARVLEDLKWLHQTANDVLVLTASGTGTMEAGIVNFLSPGDRVLVCCNGKFAERWADMCDAYGLDAERIHGPWGKALDPEAVRRALEADTAKRVKAVIVTHSETSTGVINDLETLSRHIKAHGTALSIVDAVTSLGATSVPMDAWGLDVVASASQKGYMMPPGLGFIAVSPKAWKAYETAKLPKFYLDLGKYRAEAAHHTTPFTPAINLIFGLQVALQMMQEEGLDAIFARHSRHKTAIREAVRALGLSLYAGDDAAASPAVTAVTTQPVAAETLRSHLRKHFDIALAGGQDSLEGKIVRIGHLGFTNDRDILTVISALEASLAALGYNSFAPGAGISAATQNLAT
ncbi:pyridoxal-phosphate-dependent aminotransferase family protein [Altericista sp. CCNU0014]|uniref:pyridoxal-phosphate-dependent aminotransferase family protein n=1 Tax=Altericista sp. CCNU0014 TaxID=3082949 RepID=UPI00384A510C